jgi:hypothetical protein
MYGLATIRDLAKMRKHYRVTREDHKDAFTSGIGNPITHRRKYAKFMVRFVDLTVLIESARCCPQRSWNQRPSNTSAVVLCKWSSGRA